MNGEDRIKDVLLNELGELRQRISEMETTEVQRKRVVEALRTLEKKYRNLVDNSLVGIYKESLDGDIIYVNETQVNMLGFETSEEIMSTGAIARYKDPERRKTLIEDVKKKGSVNNFEIEILTKTGKTKNVIISATLDENIISAMVMDISEHKRTEEQLKQCFNKLKSILDGTVNALASTVEKRDPYTAGHQQGVTRLARAIGNEMGLPDDQIEGIRVAGVVHDIGKIYVAAEILNKPVKLTDIEMALVKTHAQSGYEILKTIEFPWPVADVVLQHHERLDGSGYPKGLSGEDILLEARILAVADVVEAMASNRPYREAPGIDKALGEIAAKRGILYDLEVVDCLLQGNVFSKLIRG